MLESIFTRLFFMSIQAALLIMVIVGIRVLCPKIPKKYICLLWCLAALRLTLPINIETDFGLMPSAEQLEYVMQQQAAARETWADDESAGSAVMPENMTDRVQEATSESNTLDIYRETVPGNISTEAVQEQMNPQESAFGDTNGQAQGGQVQDEETSESQAQGGHRSLIHTVSILWAVGVLILLGYGAFSYIKVKRQVREAVHDRDNIWLCDRIDTPFVLGYIKPRIYMPFHINPERREYIIAHERCHLAKKDHIAKLIGYILLAVYWFQPFVWISYVLFCKDVEMACDESVIAGLGEDEKKNYSQTLLACSVDKRAILSNPLAFGEVDVKKRIQNVLHYKKPGLWIIGGSVVLVAVVALLFMTGREKQAEEVREKWTGEAGEIFMYDYRMDITHDGIMDLVVFTIEPHPEMIDKALDEFKDYKENDIFDLFQKQLAEGHIYVYKGSDGRGNYEETPLWHRGEIYWTHAGNAQISVREENGKGYLIESHMYQGMDAVDYSYKVFSLDRDGEEVLKEEESVSFYTGDFDPAAGDLTVQMPEEAKKLKAFWEKMEVWTDRAMLLLATDLSTEPCVFWSWGESEWYADSYYSKIWYRWFPSEKKPSIYGYSGYTGYLDGCKSWTNYDDWTGQEYEEFEDYDYTDFVDQDYDDDGLIDRVYRKKKRSLCDYQIEFGNGDVILIEDVVSRGIPVIKPIDLNQDGIKEILFTQEYPYEPYPEDDGNMALFEKVEGRYQEAELPFGEDPEEKWRVGLTIDHDFIGQQAVRLTVEETGDWLEKPYWSMEGMYDDYKVVCPIYETQFVQGEDGTYLKCKVSTLYTEIGLKLIYEDGEYVIRDVDFSAFTAAKEQEEKEDQEILIGTQTADLTRDGVYEKIVFTAQPHPELWEDKPLDLEYYADWDVFRLFTQVAAEGHIYVYKGLGRGQYEEETLWEMEGIYYSRVGNVQVSVVRKQGKGYLLISDMYVGQGSLEYRYRVLSLDAEGNEVEADAAEVNFRIDDFTAGEGSIEAQMPEEAALLTEFFDKLNPWVEDATLLIATDVGLQPWIFWSDEESTWSAGQYYQQVWDQWYREEVKATILGHQYYTGYMDRCDNWLGKSDFVDCDYDGDGLKDRVYRTYIGNGMCDYRIEFGNGDEVLLTEATAGGQPKIKTGDADNDGEQEILFTWEYPTSTAPYCFGEMVLLNKMNGSYEEVLLPFADVSDEVFGKWTYGIGVEYLRQGDKVTVKASGTDVQTEFVYNEAYIMEDGEYMEEKSTIYNVQIVSDASGNYLLCKAVLFGKWTPGDVVVRLDCVDGEYVITDTWFEL